MAAAKSTGAQGQQAGRLFLLTGSAPLLLERGLEALLERLGAGGEEATGVTVCDAGEVSPEEIVGHIRTVPMFADRQVVVVERAEQLRAEAQERLAAAIRGAPPQTSVVLVCSASEGAGPPGRRSPVGAALTRLVEQTGKRLSYDQPRPAELPEFVARELRDLGKRMRPPVVSAFLSMAGQDLGRLRMELEKLALYVGKQEEITEADARAVVTVVAEHTVFELVDAIGEKRADRALSVLPTLLAEGDPRSAALGVLGMIARQLRLIWQARALLDAGFSLSKLEEVPEEVRAALPTEQNLLETVKSRSFLVPRYSKQAANFDDEALARALRRVFEAEMALKGQLEAGGRDELLTLELMIADLCGDGRLAVRERR